MRCLYCGKPLPLLKKLTGGGEFCSDAHRHKYQEEYNKLALSRLLQAQTAPSETGVFPAPGGTGLRQLAAPMPPPPMGGQRALPAPSSPALSAGPPVLPPPQQGAPNKTPPTAHHQEEKLTPSPEALRAAIAPPPPRPQSDPQPDPKEAPFLVRQHEAIGPNQRAGLFKSEFDLIIAESKPQMPDHAASDVGVIPFEWESIGAAMTASHEPDPPEAPAWRHPIEIQTVAPIAPSVAAFPVEPFPAKLIRPLQPEVPLGARYPQSVRPKLNFAPEKCAFRVLPGELRLSAARDWELNLTAPDWRPHFVTIAAPAPPPPVVRVGKSSAPPAPVASPVKSIEKPAQAQETKRSVEVFIDFSALGIFDDAPEQVRTGRR